MMKIPHRNCGRSRTVSILIAVLAAGMAYVFLICPFRAAALNRVAADGQVKVFVGSSRATGIVNAYSYKKARAGFLNRLADRDPDGVYSALVVLDGYYSAQDMEAFAEKEAIHVNRIYLWEPGETGRASLAVQNNDIEGAIKRAYDRAKGLEETEEFGQAEEDVIRAIDRGCCIFSVTAEASAENLKRIAHAAPVEFADVMYSDAGKRAAEKKGISVQYIELPYKPDGAL